MKQPIFKTRAQAIKAATDRCIENGGTSDLPCAIRNTYTHCACGQTEAIEVIMFLPNEDQISAYAGICSSCGEK